MAIFIPLVTKFDPKGLNNAQTALSKFGGFAAQIAQAATAALAGVAIAGVREAAKFETSFAKIQGLVGVSAEEVAKLEEAAKRIGPAYGIAATEAADALFYITSAGLRGTDATDVLEASAKASAAGLGDLNAIANAATAAMNTYGPAVLSGTDAVAALTEAVRLGQFAPEELAGSLGQVIPISSELGVSFQETTGLIAALTRGGLPASQAITGIKGAMQAVLKPTSEAAKMLEDYGFSTESVRESIGEKGFLATFEELRAAFGDNEEDFLRLIGSIEGVNAVLSLTGENVETNREIISQQTDDIQILDEAYGAVADTAQQKFNVALEGIKTILLEVGTAILENLQPHLDNFNAFMDENGPIIEELFTKIYDAVYELGTAVGELLQESVLPKVKELLESEAFRNAIQDIYEGLGEIVQNVKDFIATDFGQFLLDLTSATIITGLTTLAAVINGVNAAIEKLNELLSGRAVKSGVIKISGSVVSYDVKDNKYVDAKYGARAKGGLVGANMPYLVGEMGPELFVPQVSGNIIPNRDTVASTNKTVNYNITVNAGMGTGNGAVLGEQIVNAIKRYERTSGPVFVSA
jgi:TP901 family phage tail tape measure protein